MTMKPLAQWVPPGGADARKRGVCATVLALSRLNALHRPARALGDERFGIVSRTFKGWQRARITYVAQRHTDVA